ncbi:glutathione transferase GST 23 [Gossypium raimondii]|uniref:glutathione transferase GST 23 n=1 Tax=Gossypium raimondii TaxID=29730 RepID=UPI00227AB1A1|nr:glutathione transferase GST 23 [Gossypium raimondii]
MVEEVKLLKTWSSPFGLRPIWALKLKCIQYESIDEDLSNKSALLLQLNPIYQKIPVLVHNRKPISESLVILEYLDQTWTQNPIMPQHPLEKARQRFWAKFNDEKVLPSIWSVFTKEGKQREEAMEELVENLKLAEEELQGKRFFRGHKIGVADFDFGWLANLISVFEQVTGFKVIDGTFPLLSTWI